MTQCPNCGYEREPKDEGIIPPTECPKCGMIYDKITVSGNKTAPRAGPVRHDPIDRTAFRAGSKKRPYIAGALVILGLIAGISAWWYVRGLPVNGWYFNVRGFEKAYKEHRETAKPLLVYVYWDG